MQLEPLLRQENNVIENIQRVWASCGLFDQVCLCNTYIYLMRQNLGEEAAEAERHATQIKVQSVQFGTALGLSPDQLGNLSRVAFLHEIGKVGLAQTATAKKGCLSAAEKAILRWHPEIGYRIIMAMTGQEEVAKGVRALYERWDGKGYPTGISGQTIPLNARIVSLVHAYDDLTKGTFYEHPFPHKQALAKIKSEAGFKYDPELVAIYLRVMQGIAG